MDSKRKSPDDLKEDYLVRLEYLKQLVNLLNDIYLSAWKNYGTAKRKMYPHRQLCMGTLIIARHNMEASIRLIEANLVDQVHYISRNIWELAINLYYILDDETVRDARLERYRRYSNEIVPFKVLQVTKKYPDEFKAHIPEEQVEVKRKSYEEFRERYRDNSGRVNINSWSGMTLDRMIDGLLDENVKKEFMTLYDFIVKQNNVYLHPSWHYLKKAVAGTAEAQRNYQSSIDLMTRVFTAAQKIAMKFLENFPKGRPEFQERLTDINGWFRSKKNTAQKAEN